MRLTDLIEVTAAASNGEGNIERAIAMNDSVATWLGEVALEPLFHNAMYVM